MKQPLSDICFFVDDRVNVAELSTDNYISTENMLPNKAGVTRSAGLPNITKTQAYQAQDVLVSNIRPYFRKIWFADRGGGCSNDVLVFRAKKGVNPKYLYYLLSDDNFFSLANATAKGTKMPRGDKKAIMQYRVPNISFSMQSIVADTLSVLDARISNNNAINNHLAFQRSATDNSPDKRRGRRASRIIARVSFSRPFAKIMSTNAPIVSVNRQALSMAG